MFDARFDRYLKEQLQGAVGQRAEMLKKELTGTKLMFENVLLPVFGSFDGLYLEQELISFSGTRIYVDVCHAKLGIAFEEEHYVTHAEKITRDRFSFEKSRARSLATLGYIYFPYSRDELEKKPEICKRNLYELIGRIGNLEEAALSQLPVFEREVIRFGVARYEPFDLADVSRWLQLKRQGSRRVIHELTDKDLLRPVGGGEKRCFKFIVTEKAIAMLQRRV